MNFILIVSIIIRIIAFILAIVLLIRARDWRLGFLALMLGLMGVRQSLTLQEVMGRNAEVFSAASELPGLAVSVLMLATIIGLERMLVRQREQQKQIAESHALYRAVIGGTTDAIFAKDIRGRYLMINSAGAAIIGKKVEEVIGRDDAELFSDGTAREIIERDRLILQSGQPRTSQEVAAVNGEMKIFSTTKNPMLDADGRVIGLIGISRDITEHKKMEDELRETQERYRDLVESAHDLIQSVTTDWHFAFVNQAWLDTLGYTSDEVPALSLSDTIHPDSLAHCVGLFEKVMEGETVACVEAAFVTKDGRSILVEGSIVPRFVDGKVVATHGFFQDVTERRLNEAARRESEERYRSLVEQAPDAIFIADSNLHFTEVNSRACSLSGYSRDELLSMTVTDFMTEEELVSNPLRIAELTEGMPLVVERRLKHRDGSLVPVEVSSKLLGDGQFQSIVRDISERRGAEEKLRISEQQFRSLIENSPDVIVKTDSEGKILFINRVPTGYRKEDLIGSSVFDYVSDESARKYRNALDETVTSGSCHPFEVEEEGVHRKWMIRMALLEHGDETESIMVIASDITERKRAEDALRESEERYRSLVLATTSIVWTTDGEGGFAVPQPSWEKYTGQTWEDHKGWGWAEMMHPEDRERIKTLWLRALTDRSLYESDGRIWNAATGQHHYFTARAVPLLNEDGSVREWIGNFTDVDDHKQAEAERARLYEAERRARQIANTLSRANLALTRSLDLDTVLETLLDYLSELVPYDTANIMLREDEMRFRVVALRDYEQWSDAGKTRSISFDIRTNPITREILISRRGLLIPDTREYPGWEVRDGAEHVRNWIGVPLIAGGQVIGLYSIDKAEPDFFTKEDVHLTESLAAQAAVAIQNADLFKQINHHAEDLEQRVTKRTAQLEAAKERAESADRMKSAFLAAMSHELRTPLNSIIGFTGIILQGMAGSLNDEQRKQLTMVIDSARHLLSLINDILDISRIEAGQLEVSFRPFDLGEVIAKAVAMTSPMAEKKGLTLLIHIEPEVGQITSDRRRVEQIVINLLNNAIKFTDRGQVRVECRVDDGRIVASVIDTGIGIKEEDIGKLFNPFQQIDTGLTRQHEGTGLGLAICKRLVRALGGEIKVESRWGAGSVFSFTLPFAGGTDETHDSNH